jgi:hypothetical protein
LTYRLSYRDEEESLIGPPYIAPPREILSPLEQAAEECCAIFDRLEPDDKRSLAVRLVALGALHEGDLGYVDQVAAQARVTVFEFLGREAKLS